MYWKKILGGAVLFVALSGSANAQSLTAEAAKTTRPDENHTLRLSGSYGPLSGFIDSYGHDGDYYTELYARKNISKMRGRKYGVQTELNDGYAEFLPATVRVGPIFDIIDSKKVYANAKFMPLTVTRRGIKKEVQIGSFASTSLPKSIYLEGWLDHNFLDSLTLGELTAGKMINSKIGAEVQAGYNVNSSGWAYRIGGRYKIR